MKYKHIIWDWNGTLVNDLWLSVEVFNNMLKNFTGAPGIDSETYRENFGFPVADFYAQFGFDLSGTKFREAGLSYMKIYNARRFECDLHSGATDAIKIFKESGLSQSILSAYEEKLLVQAVRHYKIEKYFSCIDGLNNIDAKSKIALGKAHIEKLGINPEQTVMIGDTVHDKQVADAIGADCALICSGHNARKRLSRCGAPLFDTHAQIVRYILNSQ